MLTIKQITENTDTVIKGLEKKHFKNAKEAVAKVLELNDIRRNSQKQLDDNLAKSKLLAKSIGQLMKEGKSDEAASIRKEVSEFKDRSDTGRSWTAACYFAKR